VIDQSEELPLLPPCGVMDRDSTGETPSVLCPRQAAGLANKFFLLFYYDLSLMNSISFLIRLPRGEASPKISTPRSRAAIAFSSSSCRR